jgi:subtilisin family serine protease
MRQGYTGRLLAVLRHGSVRAAASALRNAAGLRVAASTDFERARPQPGQGEALIFERLGTALLHADADQIRALAVNQPRLLLAPERCVRARELDAVRGASDRAVADTPRATWGLEATRVLSSRYTGRGIRVAILDTGLDAQHPDFAGRTIVSRSFTGEAADGDGNGHGTFCAGVACGPLQPTESPRYGIASSADIYVARVLDESASGTDGNVLAGIDWAARNRCAVVSMSIGTPAAVGDSYPRVYEQAAAGAFEAGTLLIAPAGNSSQRPDRIAPVEHPADCPSILAVGAVDPSLEVAPFSNGGLNPDGGQVDLVAPGIAIASAAPRPALYQTGSGTSMAAPFVAGIAALLAEAHPAARGAALRALLLQAFLALPALPRDVGAGLVQAPQ